MIKVRQATPKDACQILELTKESFEFYMRQANIIEGVAAINENCQNVLEDIKNKHVLVATCHQDSDHELIVGSVRIEISSNKTAYLSRFGVSQVYRNAGIGKLLLDHVDQLMVQLDISEIYLHTSSQVVGNVMLYYKAGYHISEVSHSKGYPRALFVKTYSKC